MLACCVLILFALALLCGYVACKFNHSHICNFDAFNKYVRTIFMITCIEKRTKIISPITSFDYGASFSPFQFLSFLVQARNNHCPRSFKICPRYEWLHEITRCMLEWYVSRALVTNINVVWDCYICTMLFLCTFFPAILS